MTESAADRVRTLLLRADNVLNNTVPDRDPADRVRRARHALEEARAIAGRDPAVDARVRELVDRRLESLDGLDEEPHA